jgi:hypothetical protein
MSKTRTEVIKDSKRKGLAAGLAVPTAILGWRWWKHRAENGIRF